MHVICFGWLTAWEPETIVQPHQITYGKNLKMRCPPGRFCLEWLSNFQVNIYRKRKAGRLTVDGLLIGEDESKGKAKYMKIEGALYIGQALVKGNVRKYSVN